MTRPDYCPIGGEPCQSLCVEPCTTSSELKRLRKVKDAALKLVLAPAWAGVSDEDCALEGELFNGGFMPLKK